MTAGLSSSLNFEVIRKYDFISNFRVLNFLHIYLGETEYFS